MQLFAYTPRSALRFRLVIGCLAAALAPLGSSPVSAQAVGYELLPTGEYVWWNDAFGLEDGLLYGGRFAFTFGPRVALEPFGFFRNNVEADPARIDGDSALFAGLASRELDLRHLGATVRVDLANGDVVPFLRLGGGVLRLEPENADEADQISLIGGGGIRFGLAGLAAELFAEDVAFRINRFRLFGGVGEDPDVDDLRHNVVAGAALKIPLGGGFGEVSEMSGLQGAAIPIEPFVGRLDYDSDLGLDEQTLVGARAGIDLSSLFGLRGYYWRGINDDFDDFQEVQSYGGEARFQLNAGPGLNPYVVAGAGRLNYGDGFEPADGATAPEDKTALVLGGGVNVALSERLRLVLGARDYIFDANQEFEDVRSTDDLLHNLLLSAGLGFSVGGSTPTAQRFQDPERERELRRLEQETERLRQQNQRLREQAAQQGRQVMVDTVVQVDTVRLGAAAMQVDTVVVTDEQGRQVRREVVRAAPEARQTRAMAADGRSITVPVPMTGEVYLRYGTPGGVTTGATRAGATLVAAPRLSAAEVRALVREEVRREGPEGEDVDTELLERRIAERIADRLEGRFDSLQDDDPMRLRTPLRSYDRDEQGLDAGALARLNALEQRLLDRIDQAFGEADYVPRPRPLRAARPAAVAPAAPEGREIRVCILQGGELQTVSATYRPATGDTVAMSGGRERAFAEAYPSERGYATRTGWFMNNRPVSFMDRSYVRVGLTRIIPSEELIRIGEYQGVPLFGEARTGSPPEVLYVPVRPGCEFQPFGLEETVRSPRG